MTPARYPFSSSCGFIGTFLFLLAPLAFAQSTNDSIQQRWEKEVRPIFAQNCLTCHNDFKKSGQLSLESIRGLLGNSLSGQVITPQNAAESLLLQVLVANAESHMPPKGQLSDGDIQILNSFVADLLTLPDLNSWKTETHATHTSTAAANAETFPAAVPAHLVIDFALAKHWADKQISPAINTTDAQFARRIYLDLIGRVPTVSEMQSFLASTSSAKRENLVDHLLTSPEHAVHLSELLNALFIGRKEQGPIRQAEKIGWFTYLRDVIREDRPWDEVAAEILLARPANEQQQGAVWYLYSRKNNHQEMAEAISRDFFGVRIDCAQCHDHPLADEILQRHYWGLTAFFNRSTNVDTDKGPRLAESAIGGFSEFANIRGTSAANELVFLGTDVIAEVRPAKDTKEEDREDLYIPSADGEPRIPKFSRRAQFVEHVLTDHPLVAQAMVNRMWGHMFGRGLVHPIDAMDSFHPASQPELLQWLSRDFERSGYRIRHLLRSLALSKAYQLSCSQPQPQDPSTFASFIAKPLTAEAFFRSIEFALELKNKEQFNSLENRVHFASLFPDVLAEESFANVSQGLMLSNSPFIQRFVSVKESHLLERLEGVTDSSQVLRDLFLSILQREPDNEELQRCLEHLSNATRPDAARNRSELIEDIAWALITSAEFRFNH